LDLNVVKQFYRPNLQRIDPASRLSNYSLDKKQDDFNFHRKGFLRSTGLF